jgi:GDP-L-fucose synthase
MKNVLITGGAGFLGRNFTKKLLALSYSVTSVDNFEPLGGGKTLDDDLLSHPNLKFYNEDCIQFFKRSDERFDLVLHFAGRVGGRLAIENQQLMLMKNIITDTELFLWAEKTKQKHLICMSSSAAYPVHLQTPQIKKALEEKDFNIEFLSGIPDLSYGWCKVNLEFLAKTYSKTTGLPCSVYRPFSGYGLDQSASYPIPSLCQAALKLKAGEPFYVWGNGRQARDFIHVEDIIDAVLKTYEKIGDANPLNLCTGIPTNFVEVAQAIMDILGINSPISTKDTMPSGVFNRYGCQKRLNELGFKYSIDIKQGLEKIMWELDGKF